MKKNNRRRFLQGAVFSYLVISGGKIGNATVLSSSWGKEVEDIYNEYFSKHHYNIGTISTKPGPWEQSFNLDHYIQRAKLPGCRTRVIVKSGV